MWILHKSSSWNADYSYAKKDGLAGKPGQTSFATNMHFILSDKTMLISKEMLEKRLGECKYIFMNYIYKIYRHLICQIFSKKVWVPVYL
jgi:hypothetical protein